MAIVWRSVSLKAGMSQTKSAYVITRQVYGSPYRYPSSDILLTSYIDHHLPTSPLKRTLSSYSHKPDEVAEPDKHDEILASVKYLLRIETERKEPRATVDSEAPDSLMHLSLRIRPTHKKSIYYHGVPGETFEGLREM